MAAVSRTLLRIEGAFRLFDRSIEGVHFWERVRFQMYRELLATHAAGGSSARREPAGGGRARRWATLLRHALIRSAFVGLARRDILIVGTERRVRHGDGRLWDIYCDPLINAGLPDYLYTSFHHGGRSAAAVTEGIRYLDLARLVAKVRGRIMAGPAIPPAEERLLTDVADAVREETDVRVDLAGMVRARLSERLATLPLYERLLRRVDPRVVVLVCSYGKETLIEACKRRSIPVVELQHGVVSEYHPGYSFRGRNATKRMFPDYFFAFGEYWRGAAAYPIPEERVVAMGFPYFDEQRALYGTDRHTDEILFLSQDTIAEQLSRFAAQLAGQPAMTDRITYKLHPAERKGWRERYPWLVEAGVRVVDDDQPLYPLLGRASVHVGVYSTALFEGMGFGARTIIVDLPGAEQMRGVTDTGRAILVSTVPQMMSALEGGLRTPDPADSELFFRSGAIERMRAALDAVR